MPKRKVADNTVVKNPLLQIAQGLSSSKEGQVWEEKPVDIVEFVEGRRFLNQKWNGRLGCRPKILDILVDLCGSKVRQAMVLLGKGCLGGDTDIYSDSGIKKIRDLNGKMFKVQSRDKENNFYWNNAMCVSRGFKNTRRYWFSNGRYLDMTDNHNVYVARKGVIQAKNLSIKDYVIAPRELLKNENYEIQYSYLCKMVGLLLGDGCLREKKIILTCQEENHKEFINCIKHLDPKATWKRAKWGIDTYLHRFYNGHSIHRKECKLHKMIRNLGLIGKKSKDKFVPRQLMNGTEDNIINLLSGLFSSDGWIECGRNDSIGIYYGSNSRQLLEDVQTLLLKIGIISKLTWRKKFSLGKWREGGGLEISGYEDTYKFLTTIKTTHKKQIEALTLLDQNLKNGRLSMKPSDMIPKCVANLKGKGKVGIARYRYLKLIGEDKNTRVQWLTLEKIENIGEQEVFDILCDNPDHNFIANGISIENSGKDFLAAILHLYGIYKCLCMYNPQAFFGLAPATIYFVNTARNDKQAKKVFFTQFRALLIDCLWFKGKYAEPGLESVSFIKNIEALSVNSQSFGWLGFNTLQWVGDELAFFLEQDDDEESASRADECWNAAFGSCKTRFPNDYKMVGITTPRYDDDFVMKKFEELKGRPDGYTVQAATWDINPNITKDDFKFELIKDLRRTMRDFGATPQGVLESFWPSPEKLDTYVNPKCKECPIYLKRKESTDFYACYDYDDCTVNMYLGNGQFRDFKPPVGEFNAYWGHFDLAINKDHLGFAFSRIMDYTKIELDSYRIKLKKKRGEVTDENSEEDAFELKPIIETSVLGWVSVKGGRDRDLLMNGDYHYSAILNKIVIGFHKRGFNLVGTTFDQFNSHMFAQSVEEKGFETDIISLDRTDEIPVAAKYAILEGRVLLPYSTMLLDEMKYLKHINGKKVDHSRKNSKDVWDAVAGSIWGCEQNLASSGTFVPLNE